MSFPSPQPAAGAAQNARLFPRVFDPPLVASEFGSVRDVSLGGLSVGLRQPASKGQVIEFILTDNDTYRTLVVQAEVMWASWRYAGLRFLELTDDQRDWLEERLPAWQASQAELAAQKGRGGACWFG